MFARKASAAGVHAAHVPNERPKKAFLLAVAILSCLLVAVTAASADYIPPAESPVGLSDDPHLLVFDPANTIWMGKLVDLSRWIETDADVYLPGQEVQITQGLLNQGNYDTTIRFMSAPEFEFYIRAGDKTIAPYYQVHVMFAPTRTLSPGESYTKQWTWDQTDAEGNPLPPGTYDIVGATSGIMTATAPVARITIVPEPGMFSLLLLMFGGWLSRHRRRTTEA